MELFHGFHFFAALRSVGDIEDFSKSECACTSDNVANVVLFADVV